MPEVDTTKPSTPSSPGFRAHIQDASLANLVQLECMEQTRRAVRVCSGPRVGYLFFDTGRLVHASTRGLLGDAAALEMLTWRGGTFDPAPHAPWPEEPTVVSDWAHLMACTSSRVTPLAPAPAPARSEDPSSEEPISRSRSAGEAFVHLDSESNVVTSRGQTDELATLVAYATQTARRLGAALGEEQFLALEWATEDEHGVMFVDEDGGVTALKARDEKPLARTKSRFNL